jgi:hypothetical protein
VILPSRPGHAWDGLGSRSTQDGAVAVRVEEVVGVQHELVRQLRCTPKHDPRRGALEASLSDLDLLHRWLTTATYAESAARLDAARRTLELAQALVADRLRSEAASIERPQSAADR